MAESIRETLVQYPSDKVTMRAYVAAPQTKERRPAIIVVQEWWGLTDHIKDVAKRYAAEGYVAIAPDQIPTALSSVVVPHALVPGSSVHRPIP